MDSLKEIKSIFQKKYPDRTIKQIGIYKNGYLVAAPIKGVEMDYEDPYFTVSNGTIAPFLPINDFDGFGKAFTKNLVYSSGGE